MDIKEFTINPAAVSFVEHHFEELDTEFVYKKSRGFTLWPFNKRVVLFPEGSDCTGGATQPNAGNGEYRVGTVRC